MTGTKKAALALGAVLVAGTLALPALSHGDKDSWRERWHGQNQPHMGMMDMMMGPMMGRMMDGPGMMMDRPGMMMGRFGPMRALMEEADTNDDGEVTPDEMRAVLAKKLTEYDANGDGSLSLEEFAALHAALTRNLTVDRFQALDEDGDGKVTAEEFAAPADRMERMMKFREHHRDDRPGRMMKDGE